MTTMNNKGGSKGSHINGMKEEKDAMKREAECSMRE
jgi:hypothetical protein